MAGAADLNVTSEQVVSYNNEHVHVNGKQALEIAAVVLWVMFLTLDFLDLLRYVPLVLSVHIAAPVTVLYSWPLSSCSACIAFSNCRGQHTLLRY